MLRLIISFDAFNPDILANKTSQHILSASANLLGVCLFIITSLHISNHTENSLIDEFTAMIALLLTVSSVLSFISIRTENPKMEVRLENMADYLFMISLIGICTIIFFVIITFWKQ